MLQRNAAAHAPEAQLKIWGHCIGPGDPMCFQELPPSSEAYTSLKRHARSDTPHDVCLRLQAA